MKTVDINETLEKTGTDAFTGKYEGYLLEVYWDNTDPHADDNWCWRITDPDGYANGDVSEDFNAAVKELQEALSHALSR